MSSPENVPDDSDKTSNELTDTDLSSLWLWDLSLSPTQNTCYIPGMPGQKDPRGEPPRSAKPDLAFYRTDLLLWDQSLSPEPYDFPYFGSPASSTSNALDAMKQLGNASKKNTSVDLLNTQNTYTLDLFVSMIPVQDHTDENHRIRPTVLPSPSTLFQELDAPRPKPGPFGKLLGFLGLGLLSPRIDTIKYSVTDRLGQPYDVAITRMADASGLASYVVGLELPQQDIST